MKTVYRAVIYRTNEILDNMIEGKEPDRRIEGVNCKISKETYMAHRNVCLHLKNKGVKSDTFLRKAKEEVTLITSITDFSMLGKDEGYISGSLLAFATSNLVKSNASIWCKLHEAFPLYFNGIPNGSTEDNYDVEIVETDKLGVELEGVDRSIHNTEILEATITSDDLVDYLQRGFICSAFEEEEPFFVYPKDLRDFDNGDDKEFDKIFEAIEKSGHSFGYGHHVLLSRPIQKDD